MIEEARTLTIKNQSFWYCNLKRFASISPCQKKKNYNYFKQRSILRRNFEKVVQQSMKHGKAKGFWRMVFIGASWTQRPRLIKIENVFGEVNRGWF